VTLPQGYTGPPELTPAQFLTQWSPEPALMLGVIVAGVLYLAGVRRLHSRRVAWSGLRTASFVLGGLGTIVVATMSALGAYDDTLFSVHMVQHMLLAMVAPVFLALGAPVTLALRTAPDGARRMLLGVLHSRVVAVLASPPVGWLLFVGTPFALYFTGLYGATLRHDTLHSLLHVHFLLVGCLFFWPLLGLDPVPGRVAYGFRLALVFATLPFHAFLGISIMNSTTVIAGTYYAAQARPWGAGPLSDQHTGGGILWATGDVVGLLLLVTVVAQWMRADERIAAREDRRLDRLERATSPR
jgi:cytochrome c oxidase assembly factor CtaG